MKKFHENDYDGIVLKIPSWFIEMNELQEPISSLKTALENSKKSMYYLDHLRNLDEITHYKEKKSIIETIRKEQQQKLDEERNRRERLFQGELYELEWREVKSFFDLNDGKQITIDNEVFDADNVFTPKMNVKSDFANKFKKYINFETASIINESATNVDLWVDMEHCDSSFIDFSNCTLSYSHKGWDLLGLGYKRLMIRTDIRKSKDGGYKYRPQRLIKFEDGCLGYGKIRLEGFKIKGMSLIK